jgi:hypothetical protein
MKNKGMVCRLVNVVCLFSWSLQLTQQLPTGRAGIAFNDRIFWAGGHTSVCANITGSCLVEIHNLNTGNVSIQKKTQFGQTG